MGLISLPNAIKNVCSILLLTHTLYIDWTLKRCSEDQPMSCSFGSSRSLFSSYVRLKHCRGDDPCISSHTQTGPCITDSEVRHVLDCLYPHKRAGPDEHFSEVLKDLSPRIAPILARTFTTF